MTEEILNNRQRTSAVNGITKAEAVLEFSATLEKYGIDYFQNIPAAMKNNDLEADIRTIPGQSSGISPGYFWMLAGSDEYTKPDRMVLGFLRDALGRNVPGGRRAIVDVCRHRPHQEFPARNDRSSARLRNLEVSA